MSHPSVTQQITFIYTSDLEQSAHFYEAILGLNLWLDQGGCRIYEVSSSGYLGICQTSDNSKGQITSGPQTNVILTIVTQEVDAWYDHLLKRGVTFEKSPEINPKYNIYHCFLRDPNGYLIEIQRFLEAP
jgi:catechol 2,3-dioxygenase-like lactoylglutathione lyase family enzyme